MKKKFYRGARRLSAIMLSAAMIATSVQTNGLTVYAEEAETVTQVDQESSQQESTPEKERVEKGENDTTKDSDNDEHSNENDKNVTSDSKEESEEESEEVKDKAETVKLQKGNQEETTESETETITLQEEEIALSALDENYADKTEYPKYIYDDLSNLPQKITLQSGEVEEEIEVTWEADKNQDIILGEVVKFVPKTEDTRKFKGFDISEVSVKGPVVSEKMIYLIDAGTAIQNKTAGVYAIAKDAADLKNEKEDQQYVEGKTSWGYVGTPNNKGFVANYYNMHATGLYGDNESNSKDPAYYVTLDAGEYEVTAGFIEWWSGGNARNFQLKAEYEDKNGDTVTVDLGDAVTLSEKGKAAHSNGTFKIETNDTLVKITSVRQSGDAAVLSYLVIEDTGIEVKPVDKKENPNLLAEYSFKDLDGLLSKDTVIKDESDNENDATILGDGLSAKDGMLTFPGGKYNTDNYVELPGDMFEGKDTLTISAWLQDSTGGGDYASMYVGTKAIVKSSWKSDIPQYYWLLNSHAKSEGYFKSVMIKDEVNVLDNGGYAPYDHETTPAKDVITTSDWNLYTTVITEDKIYGYYNGELVSEDSHEKKLSEYGDDLVAFLGASPYGDKLFKGSMADIEIYDIALSEEEILEKYNDDLEIYHPTDEKTKVLADLDAIEIPNLDDIRGNITLPTIGSKYESVISWESSDEKIIATDGIVNRQDEDKEVTLTATAVSKEDETITATKEFVATVKEKVEQKDYKAYLFTYFTGEGYANGEQIYFATSQDGLNWTAMNNGAPVLESSLGEKGLRDPFIIRSPEGDKFYLIATDLRIYNGNGWNVAQTNGSKSIMVWESTDLVNWSDQRMVEVACEDAGCTWAPEAFYNDETGEYVVFWSSKTGKDNYTYQRVYYATTRDFYSFSEPELWIELHNEQDETISVIDSTVIKVGDTYYRFSKDEASSAHKKGSAYNNAGKYVFVEKSKDLFGDWEEIDSNITAITGQEGPTSFRFNDEDKWCLLLDNFGGVGYHPLITTDLNSGEFEELSSNEYSFPSTMRHGTVINITQEEFEAINKKWNSDYKDYSFVIDGQKANSNKADAFKGIGAASVNNSSRLLLDYKSENEDAYWDIMNTLFNKETGAGLSHIKVELGSDVNSSSGTEPASMRSENEKPDVTRGAGWIFASDAKKINPDIEIDALRWAEPAWVNGDYAKRYKWYIETIKAVYDTYGLKLDYLSADQNETEKSKVDVAWIKYLKNALNKESTSGYYDFSEIKIVASDELQTYGLPALMMEDEELRDAVDAIGIHYTTKADDNMLTLNEEYGKEIFYSEGVSPTTPANEAEFLDGSGLTGTNGVLDVANRIINSYYNGSMVLYEYQPSVAAYYEGTKYFPKQIMTANTPWSGYFNTDMGVWMSAHFMQFIDAGWQYVDGACFGDGTESQTIKPDSSTNNYVTLTDPETGDYTIVAVNDTAKKRIYKVQVTNLLKVSSELKLIESIGPDSGESFDANWFKAKEMITPVANADGSYTIEFSVSPYSMITLTTLVDRGPAIGKSGITQSNKENKVLDQNGKYLFSDDYEYKDSWLESRGYAPLYTTDQGGAFEVVNQNGNKVLMQKITSDIKPTDWRYRTTPNPYTVLGDDRWANYTVAVDVTLDASNKTTANYAGVGARHITTNNNDSGLDSGYQLYLYGDGTWTLLDVSKKVASGVVSDFDISKTYTLSVECRENRIVARINDLVVANYTDTDSVAAVGKVVLMSGYFNTSYDNLTVEGIKGHAAYATERIDNFSHSIDYSSKISHTTNAGYGYYGRTISKATAGNELSISFSNKASKEGTANAFYYFKKDGSSWGANSQNAWAGTAGDYYSVTFEGTGITLKAVCNGSNGTGTVYLDGKEAGSVNQCH